MGLADLAPEREVVGDASIEARKSRERAQLKADYDRWRKEPFTELFLSYFRAAADMQKDMCVQADAKDRDAHAHYYQAYERVASMSDAIYHRADSDIERRYAKEIMESDREIYGGNSKGGQADLQPGGDDSFRGEGF